MARNSARDPSPIGALTLELLGGKTRLSVMDLMGKVGPRPFKSKVSNEKRGYPYVIQFLANSRKT